MTIKEKKIDVRYWIAIIVFVLALLGSYVDNKTDNALLRDQVKRNTKTLEENNLEIINYKLDAILKALEN